MNLAYISSHVIIDTSYMSEGIDSIEVLVFRINGVINALNYIWMLSSNTGY